MSSQPFTIQRINQQFTITKSQKNGLSYELFVGNQPTLSTENKQFLATFSDQAITFPDPDSSQRLYFYLRSETTHYLIAERKVMVQLNNLRDLGGYLTDNGQVTRYGLLFRSDDLFPLPPEDCRYLEAMAIRSIVDYRSLAERNSRPNKKIATAQEYICSPNASMAELASASMETDKERIDQLLKIAESPDAQTYFEKGRAGMAEEMARFVEDPLGIAAFKGLLTLVKNPDNAPLIQHCRGGKDRTGYGTALILILLGVPTRTIFEDYLLTIDMNRERNHKRMQEYQQYTDHPMVLKALADAMSTQESYLQASFDAMTRLSGTPLDYICHYLGISEAEIIRMRQAYCYSPER